MIRSSFGQSRYVAGEWDAIFDRPGVTRPLIWCHGNNGNATNDFSGYSYVFNLFARYFKVYVADLGGNTFGNDTGIARVASLVTYAGNGPVVLVGASMGASVAINYAVRNPTKVLAIANVIPALDFNSVDSSNLGWTNLNAAYPPAYNAATDGPTHNPLQIANQLPSNLPVKLWTSSDDPTCPPATADAFVAARPQTQRTVIGAYGHGGIAIAAPDMLNWMKAFA